MTEDEIACTPSSVDSVTQALRADEHCFLNRDEHNDDITAHAIKTVFATREHTTTARAVRAHMRDLECFCCDTVVKLDMSHVFPLRLI